MRVAFGAMDLRLRILGSPPGTQELADALMAAAGALDQDVCFAFDGRYHFMVGGGWSIALSADSADRVRVEMCLRSVPRTRMWVLAKRHDRLVGLVTKMLNEVPELV